MNDWVHGEEVATRRRRLRLGVVQIAALLVAVGCGDRGLPESPPTITAEAPSAEAPSAAGPPISYEATGDLTDTTLRGLSLQRLTQRLRDCDRRGDCADAAFLLDDLKIVDGFVTDPRDQDVVLFGRADSSRPPLHVEDFVVALRNSWHEYVETRGNTRYYSDPGCSIDPDPVVMGELQQVGQRVLSASGNSGVEEWNRVCRKPQDVRVLGIPFDTRFAKVMVEADYHMKTQVDGTDPLDLPGFTSLTDMTLEQIRAEVTSGQPVSVAMSTMNRFWFYPGENLFQKQDGIFFIRRSPVALLTHQTHVDASGQVADAAGRDPLAERFAESFTSVFDQVASQRPIYQELEGLFRFVALARLLELQVRPSPFAASLSYLLEEFPVPTTPVDRKKAGRPNVKGFEHREAVPGGEQIITMQLPSCGGVTMDVEVSAEKVPSGSTSLLPGVRAAALRGKDESDGVSWHVRDVAEGATTDLERSANVARLKDKDRAGSEFFVFDATRDEQPEIYALFSGTEADPLYRGSDFDELLAAVLAHSGSRKISLHRSMGSKIHDQSFDWNLDTRFADLPQDVLIDVVQEEGEIAEKLGKTTIEEVGTPMEIREGPRQGWFETTLTVLHSVGDVVRRFVVTIRAQSEKALLATVASIQSLVGSPLTLPLSLTGTVYLGIRDAQKTLPFSREKVEAAIREVVKSQAADLPRPRERRRA